MLILDRIDHVEVPVVLSRLYKAGKSFDSTLLSALFPSAVQSIFWRKKSGKIEKYPENKDLIIWFEISFAESAALV